MSRVAYMVLLLGLLLQDCGAGLLPAAYRRNHTSSGVSFTDPFTRADSGTLGGNYTSVSGTVGIVSNQAVASGAAGYVRQIYTTDTNTVTQYIKLDVVAGFTTGYPEVILRSNSAGTAFYTVYWNGPGSNQVVWAWTSGGSVEQAVQTGSLTLANGDSMGATVTGTGTATVVKVWKNPSGSAPTSSTTWGGASADVTFTNDPSTAIDTGTRVGIGGYNMSGITYDNLSGGDVTP